jgi:hypothetical protein
MKLLRFVACATVAALAACRPAQSPDARSDAALRSKVLMLYVPEHDDVVGVAATPKTPFPGAIDHRLGGSCTGSVVEGGVLTAAHCAVHSPKVMVRTPDGTSVATKLARVDTYLDVALLASDAPLPASLRIPLAERSPATGVPVAGLGATRFGFAMFAAGTTVGRNDTLGRPRVLVDMLAWPGLSGGPIVVGHGGDLEMVGVATGWLNFDADGHARMLEIAPIEAIADFLAGKPSAASLAAAAFARPRREATTVRLDTTEEPRDKEASLRRVHLAPHVMRAGVEAAEAIDLELTRGGQVLARASVPANGDFELPVAASESAGILVTARGPDVGPTSFVLDNPSALAVVAVPDKSVRFQVSPKPRQKNDEWVDFDWSAFGAQGLEGHGVVLRPIVLRGHDIVGSGSECYYPDLEPEFPMNCADTAGRVWAPTGGTYDVVLLSGSTPVAYQRWDVPAPEMH